MTVTRIYYFLMSYSVLWSVIQAYQPHGYLGCFKDFEGDSLENPIRIYHSYMSNKGDVCKGECKNHTKRYAGTKEGKCYCGTSVVQNKNRSSTECNQTCPGKHSETCGGKYKSDYYDRISLYDTWPYQPEGYLGCFEYENGNSLVNPKQMYVSKTNIGDVCKAECEKHAKRYAGTKERFCYCGSGVVQIRKRNSTECSQPCPGNNSENCGGIFPDRISLYDTWLCITGPCINGATCTDTDADNFNCSCSVGWTGRLCNETVLTSTTKIFSLTILSSSTAQKDTSTSRLSPSSSRQGIGSTTVIEKVTTTTYSIFSSSSRHGIGSSTPVAQPSDNKTAIYIAVPVSIVVLIMFVLIVTVLILRKRLCRNKDGRKTEYQKSANTGRSLLAVATSAYHENDTIPLETSVNVHATEDAATSDSEHNYYTLEQTRDGNRNYNNTDQRSDSAIGNDDNSYGHLHVRPTALFDPTYSHTTTTGPEVTTDNTYSHMDLSVGNKNDVMSNVDRDTYNTCNMKGDVGKLRPAVEINDTDDTYNSLVISGKATNMGENHYVSSLNEPEYDHTDVRNP